MTTLLTGSYILVLTIGLSIASIGLTPNKKLDKILSYLIINLFTVSLTLIIWGLVK